jgi:hypothetical protein
MINEVDADGRILFNFWNIVESDVKLSHQINFFALTFYAARYIFKIPIHRFYLNKFLAHFWLKKK